MPNLEQDRRYIQLKALLNELSEDYSLSKDQILTQSQDIPLSIFQTPLSGLELIVRYLKDHKELSFSEIAQALKRSRQNIHKAYTQSHKKHPKQLQFSKTDSHIPLSKFSKQNILATIVCYLKDEKKLRYSQIAQILQRNQRTIWTVYYRAK